MERLDRQFGDYRLVAKIAKGGQSEVFLGARSGPHGFFRPVVIKALPDRLKGERRMEALFYQEATLSSRFSHPNVVTVHDAKRLEDDHFMVMDFVAGQTVDEIATRVFGAGDELSWQEVLVITLDACRGLEHVHQFQDVDGREFQIVHCDISPQNLIVTYGGTTRVFDFGISQVVGESGAPKLDLIGGKFAYMSPEQCLEEGLDQRSDLFSLGIILYELLTRQRLFRRDSQEEVVQAITEEPIAEPRDVRSSIEAPLSAIIMKALAREPEDRWEDAKALAEALESYLDDQEVDVEEVRQQLGTKIADHFEEERDKVAEVLRGARREMSEQVFSSHRSASKEGAEEETGEGSAALREELDIAEKKVASLRKSATRASEVAELLTEEVKRLQKRQGWFIAGLLALSLICLGIASMSFLAGEEPADSSASQVVGADEG